MKKIAPILFAVMVLVFSSLACEAFNPEMSAENLRMAYDQDGEQVTSTFSVTDVIYAIVDLNSVTQGTAVKAKWVAVDVADTESGLEIQEQTIDITEDSVSGTIYFQLSNADEWPTGLYRVDIYLDDTLSQSLEFNIQ